jgi:hypothetical protein
MIDVDAVTRFQAKRKTKPRALKLTAFCSAEKWRVSAGDKN